MSGIKYTGGWFGSGGLIGGSYAPTKAGYFMKNPFVNRPTYFQPGEEGYVFRALSEEEANINGGRKLKQVLRDDPNITLREAEVKVRADWVDSWVNAAGEPPVKVYPNSKFTISKWLNSGGVGEVEFAGTLKRQLKDFRSSQSDKAFSQGDYDKATEWNNTKFQDIVDLHSDSLQTFNQENYGGMQDARWSLQENYALQNLTKVETPGIEMTDIDPMADPKYTHGMDWDLYEKVKTKEEQVRDYDEGWEEREFKKVIEQDTKDWLERGKQATYRGTKTEWLQPQPAIEEPYGEFEDDEAWEKSGLEKNSRSAQLLEDLEDKYGEWWEDHSEFTQKALDDIHEFDMEHGQFGDLESISHIDDPSRFETFDDLIDYVENKYGKNWYSNNEAQIEIGEWEHPQSGASGYLKDLRQQTFMTDIPQAGFEADLGALGQDVMHEYTLEQLLAADEIPISYVAAMRASALSRGAQKFWSPLQRKIDAFAESTNNLYGDLRDLSQHRDLGLGAHEYEVGGDDPMAILDYARTSLAEQRQAIQKAQSKHWYNEQKAEFEKVLGQIEELKLQGLELSTEYQVQTADLHRWVKNAEEFMQSGAIPQEDTAAFRSMLEEANQHSSQNWAEPENTNLLLEHTGLDGQLLDFQMEHGIMNERWTSGFWQGRNVPGDENVEDAKYGEEEADELRDYVDAEGKPYYTFDADGNPITFDGEPLEPKTDFVDDTRAELESWVDADGKPYYTFDADGNPIAFDGEPIFPKTDFVSEPHYRHRKLLRATSK